MKIFSKVSRWLGRLFSASNLSAAEAFVAEVAPDVAADLVAISKTLPGVFSSLEPLAAEAVKLVHDLRGVTISKSLAIHLAQAVLTKEWPEVDAEARTLLASK